MPEIAREEIIGRRVGRVLETVGTTEDDITVNRAFVVLEGGGPAFEMFGPDRDADPILTSTPNELHDARAKPSPVETQAVGQRIVLVVESPYWASFGMLLENGAFLYQDFSFKTLRVFLTPAERVDFDEMVDYWTRRPVSRADVIP